MRVNLEQITPRGFGKTSIEWADYTANPVRAVHRVTGEVGWHCRKVSAGCANCYAETINKRFGTHTTYTAAAAAHVRLVCDDGVLWKLLTARPRGPFKNGRARPAIFMGDMNDLYYGDDADRRACEAAGAPFEPVPFEWMDKIMAVCALRPDMDFLFLTKRPARMAEHLTREATAFDRAIVRNAAHEGAWREIERLRPSLAKQPDGIEWPLPNVWLGTSCENQAAFDERVAHLKRCPAAVLFLSCEPLLGPIDFGGQLRARTRVHMCASVSGMLRNKSFAGLQHKGGAPMTRAEAKAALEALRDAGVGVIPVAHNDPCEDFDDQKGCPGHRTPGIDGVIVGGESGRGARPCDVSWVRSIIAQCKADVVPCFTKQLGSMAGETNPTGESVRSWGECRIVARDDGVRYLLRDPKGGDVSEWPDDMQVRQMPGAVEW